MLLLLYKYVRKKLIRVTAFAVTDDPANPDRLLIVEGEPFVKMVDEGQSPPNEWVDDWNLYEEWEEITQHP